LALSEVEWVSQIIWRPAVTNFRGAQAASLQQPAAKRRRFADVSGKLPETAGQQPALPGRDAALRM